MMYKAVSIQSFAGYSSMEIGKRKDSVPSCGLLNKLCSVFIRFGAVVTRFRNAFPW